MLTPMFWYLGVFTDWIASIDFGWGQAIATAIITLLFGWIARGIAWGIKKWNIPKLEIRVWKKSIDIVNIGKGTLNRSDFVNPIEIRYEALANQQDYYSNYQIRGLSIATKHGNNQCLLERKNGMPTLLQQESKSLAIPWNPGASMIINYSTQDLILIIEPFHLSSLSEDYLKITLREDTVSETLEKKFLFLPPKISHFTEIPVIQKNI